MKAELFVDRSTEVQSAALVADGRVVRETTLDGADSRSGDWAARVRDFAAGAEIARVVVGTGPGSFAGIRAALAFAQGYAIGSGCEVAGLPSACAFAPASGPLAVVGDARRGSFWVALFDGARLDGGIFLTDGEGLRKSVPAGTKVVTPDSRRIDAVLRAAFGEDYIGGATPTAGGLARAALANPSLPVPEPLPVYLSPAVR